MLYIVTELHITIKLFTLDGIMAIYGTVTWATISISQRIHTSDSFHNSTTSAHVHTHIHNEMDHFKKDLPPKSEHHFYQNAVQDVKGATYV